MSKDRDTLRYDVLITPNDGYHIIATPLHHQPFFYVSLHLYALAHYILRYDNNLVIQSILKDRNGDGEKFLNKHLQDIFIEQQDKIDELIMRNALI